MLELAQLTATMLYGGALVSVRVVAMLAATPFFRDPVLPFQVKALFSALIAVLVVPLIPLPVAPPASAAVFAAAVVGEIALGLCMGFVIQLLLEGLRIAGELIEIQIGLSFNLGDPTDPLGPTLTAQLYYLIAGMLFMLSGAYSFVIAGLVDSFTIAPVGAVFLHPLIGAPAAPYSTPTMINHAGAMFVATVKIAAPILVAMLVTTFVFGLMARTMPQLNIFIVSYPIRIALGVVLLIIGLPLIGRLTQEYYRDVPRLIAGVLRYAAPPG